MSLPAAALRKMLEMGLSLEQAVELAEVWEEGVAVPTPQLSKGALRTRQWRERLEATGLTAEEWRVTSLRIIARDQGACQYCGTTKGRMACDHVTPLAAGGSSTDDNLVCACHACNGGKSGKTLETWLGAAKAAQWRYHRVTSRDISHVGAGAPVVLAFSSSLRSEEVGVGGVGASASASVPPTDDWPAGKASDHADLLVQTVASPWLDPQKSPDLVTTRGRVAAWKRDGASWEHDVLPVVTGLCANRRSRIASWKFFDDAICRSIAENRAALTIPEAAQRRQSTGPPSFTDQIAAEHAEARRRVLES